MHKRIMSFDAYYGSPGAPAIVGDHFKGVPPEGNVIKRNVAIGEWFEAAWHAKVEAFDVQDNFVSADAKVLGSAAEGFWLPEDSAGWKVGFQAIPIDRIGMRRDEDRQRLERISPVPLTGSDR